MAFCLGLFVVVDGVCFRLFVVFFEGVGMGDVCFSKVAAK